MTYKKKKKNVNVNMGLWSRRPSYYSQLLWCLSAPQAPGRLYSLVSEIFRQCHTEKTKNISTESILNATNHLQYILSLCLVGCFFHVWIIMSRPLSCSPSASPFPLFHCIPATPLKGKKFNITFVMAKLTGISRPPQLSVPVMAGDVLPAPL